MKCMKFVLIAASSFALIGCTETKTMNLPVSVNPTVGLRNPGAYPGQNFGNGGATNCNTRNTVNGYIPFCPIPDDGDEFDSRNNIQTYAQIQQPVTYIQQPVGGFGVGVSLGAYSDVDPMISASVEAGAPIPTEY